MYVYIAKLSICIGQRFVRICRGIASQLGNDDFCSHGPSLSHVLSLFLSPLYIPQIPLLSTILRILETLFQRQTSTNSIRVSQEQTGLCRGASVYIIIRRIVIMQCGICFVNTSLSVRCIRNRVSCHDCKVCRSL